MSMGKKSLPGLSFHLEHHDSGIICAHKIHGMMLGRGGRKELQAPVIAYARDCFSSQSVTQFSTNLGCYQAQSKIGLPMLCAQFSGHIRPCTYVEKAVDRYVVQVSHLDK